MRAQSAVLSACIGGVVGVAHAEWQLLGAAGKGLACSAAHAAACSLPCNHYGRGAESADRVTTGARGPWLCRSCPRTLHPSCRWYMP